MVAARKRPTTTRGQQMKVATQNQTSALRMGLAVLSLAGLAACSAEVTAPPVTFPAIPAPQTASKAMAIEGKWGSGCFAEQGTFQKHTMTFKDDTVSTKVDLYSTATCAGSPMHSVTVDGVMLRFGSSVYVTGGHDVEVTMKNPDGSTQKTQAVFLLESGKLYTSDADATTPGQWPSSVDRTRAYTYIGG